MPNNEPTKAVNLDQYGDQALPWSAVVERLESAAASGQDVFTVLGTVLPDGRPHAAPVGALWIDGAWYVVSGPGTRKSRNLTGNPACTLSARLPGCDVVFTGEAHRVTDPDELERAAEVYRRGGWPAEVAGDAFTAPYTAPSGGPPPWHLYRITCEQAVGVGSAPPLNGATKWTFS
jgi:nitroimidazol reductase NimA-like FMN-containing flavoprotein (pyridoxamine 5'-phosphate oxidase superfamily)